MPRVVDHDARRREVTAVAAELIASEGRSALTVRNVATRAGYSTKVVSHYFADIGDLLHETYDHAAGRARARINAVLDHDPADIQGLIEAVLPLDAVRRDDWRIWFAFWSEALATPSLAKDQRRRARAETKRIATCLQRMRDDGSLTADVDIERAADRLSALVPGIAAEAIFDPTRWTPTRQRRVLRDALASLGIHLD